MIKSFNLTEDDAIKKLEKEKNQSLYIQNLILRDVNDESGTNQYEIGIRTACKYMQQVLDILNDMAKIK